jgi:hypothetical protein
MRDAGRQRWITIGRHGSPWTPNTARTEALRLLAARAAGHDPAIERDRQKAGLTVADLGERFLEEYAAKHCNTRRVVSALPPEADMCGATAHGLWTKSGHCDVKFKPVYLCELKIRTCIGMTPDWTFRAHANAEDQSVGR